MKRLIIMVVSFYISAVVQAEQLTFGIVPQQSAITLANNWGPILKYLSEQTGQEVVFRTAKDIPEFESRVVAGEYDIAYMNPYHYTVFHERPGYQAFAKQKDKKIRGIIVVRKDSSIKDLTELSGEKLAFPSPAAFAASVIPRAVLEQKSIPFDPKYVSSHDSVYLNVSKGFFKAGGGIERTLNNTSENVREQLKVLWRTPAYTPHAFATHPDMPEEQQKRIAEALLSLNDSEQGRELLDRIKFKGVEPATNSEWDDVRALDIKLLNHLLATNSAQ